MSKTPVKTYADLEKELADQRLSEKQARRKVALLTAMVRTFRETLDLQSEEEVARTCLKVAEELTGSAIGFIGELNPDGLFDTTTLSDAGWDACMVPRPEAYTLLKSMPNRGINRVGLQEGRAWIINDPAAHPDAVRKPQGHPAIRSFLGVPLRFMGGITGMIALANKEPGYNEADLEDMEALAVAFSEVLNRRRAEQKVEELNEELRRNLLRAESANRELETFSYSVSHDLRAPLRHITGFVELLHKRDHGELDEKSRHYLRVISESALKMGSLIDDLLAFSRMGRAEMNTTRFDFGRMVREIAAELTEEEQGREIIWKIGDFPAVEGDPAMLRLVMVNLMVNALKFTRSHARAEIAVGALTDRPDETVFYIRDNGVGFDMKYVDKLFGLFQRLHSTEEFEGSGVGLANVQRIIHRHGGRTWAEGKPGEGAVFWFTLPKKGEA